MGSKVWEFVRWSVATLVVWMLTISKAPPLGIALVWCSLAGIYIFAED